ncbi:hypothetical protein JCM3774_002432 [Rhodotorula dairenensis]
MATATSSRLASPEPLDRKALAADSDGDAPMRNASEEPTSLGVTPPPPTGIPLGQANLQRNPSLRARDAFARLRIGSAGSAAAAAAAAAAPRPVQQQQQPLLPAANIVSSHHPQQQQPQPSNMGASTSTSSKPATIPAASTSSASSVGAVASAKPIPTATDGASLSRAGSIKSPTLTAAVAPGMAHASPAASFLSAFSPPSSIGNRSPSPPLRGGCHNMPAFGSVLPPRGDQSGYKIVLPAEEQDRSDDPDHEYEYEYEYVLGKELGRGGMGLVREATRRKIRHRRRQQHRRRPGRGNTAAANDQDREDQELEETVRVAVKIIPRHQGHALPFSEAMGIRTGFGASVGGMGEGTGTVQRSASLRQGPSSGAEHAAATSSHVQRSFSLSQSQSPFASSGHLLRHHPSQFAPASSATSSSSSTSTSPVPVASQDSRRTEATSSSSLAARKGPTGLNLGYGRSRPGGALSRGISLAAVEQSPLPTPDGQDDSALLLGTSAPERDFGGFFARARANTVGVDRPGSRGSSSGPDEGRDGDRGQVDEAVPAIDLDTAEPEDLLDLLLQREISLWRQLTHLAPVPHAGIALPRPTGFTGKGGHPYVVALLGTHRSDEFDYIFMPLAEGGTLLEYLNDPSSSSSTANSNANSRSGSRSGRSSRSVSPSRSASPPALREPGRSSSRGRGRKTTTKPRPRASIPFAGSLSPPSSSALAAAATQKKGLSLRRAGDIFLQVVDGLRWLHEEARVVHRDLKLENIVGCWSVATDEELAAAAAAEADAATAAEAEREGMVTRGRSRSRMRHDQLVEARYASRTRGGRGGGAGTESSLGGQRHRRRRVWKLADFGLAEIMPHQHHPHDVSSSPSPAAGVQGVQPLAALARAGSLHRPDVEGRGGGPAHALRSSVGPGSGLSHSTILPARPPQHASTLPPQQQIHRPSPTAATMQAQTASPLSALLHPVGSLPYSSPEALRSSVPIVHPCCDIWALGCVLYALVAGRLPIWDEWELRLRVQLVKGEWEVPEELDATRARSEEDRVEREMVLEVLKGCLEKDVERRWTVRQVSESRWVALARQRDSDSRAGRTPTASTVALQVEPSAPALPRRSSRNRTAAAGTAQSLGLFPDVHSHGSTTTGMGSPARSSTANLSLGPSPEPMSPNSDRTLSRGRPSTRSSSHSHGHGPPPAPSAGASGHHTADGGSSPVIGRGGLPSSSAADERGRSAHALPKSASCSRTRLSTRSTSRSSAYAHQYGAGGGSELADQERKERGRSERRRRWDEVGSSSGRRSVSRTSTGTASTSASGLVDDSSGLGGQSTPAEQDEDLMLDEHEEERRAAAAASSGPSQRTGRSVSRRRPSSRARGDRDDSGGRSGGGGGGSASHSHHLETVGEPY